MNRLVATLALGLAAMTSFAPVNDKPNGAQYFPEQSEATVSQQQSLQGTVPLVGEPPIDSEKADPIPFESEDSSADLVAATAKSDRTTFAAATQRVAEAKRPSPSPLWYVFGACLLSLLVVLGFRQYANKVVPEYNPQKR